jgi:hypothetical protein
MQARRLRSRYHPRSEADEIGLGTIERLFPAVTRQTCTCTERMPPWLLTLIALLVEFPVRICGLPC